MQRVVITGANRGIGLELVHQLLARGDLVFASCRKPSLAVELQMLASTFIDHLFVLELDVTDQETVDTCYEFIRNKIDGLDLLINNAGIYPSDDTLSNLNRDSLIHTYHVNAVGPVMIVKRFLELLRSGDHPKIINISSDAGSLQTKTEGDHYSYSSSKAALNMLTRTLANDIRADHIVAISVHPGWVQTDMGGKNAKLTPAESVNGLLKLIDQITLDKSGKYFTYEGTEYPW